MHAPHLRTTLLARILLYVLTVTFSIRIVVVAIELTVVASLIPNAGGLATVVVI
jgi:hypothetical protein